MITCTKTNFGVSEINFKGYTSPSLCILNGVFTVYHNYAEYQAAERLEISLPADFPMKKSAVSSAILMSGTENIGTGTPIRCHIEDGKLCFEKLSIYDSYGPMTIIVASAFVTRGYRGPFMDSETTEISFKKTLIPKEYYCHALVKDEYVSFAVVFEEFPWSSEMRGPVSIPIDNLPTDIDVKIPICVNGNYDSAKPGSMIMMASLQNGHLHYVMPSDAPFCGGEGCFTTLFATRGTYTPAEPVAGEFGGVEGDFMDDENTESFIVNLCSNNGKGTLMIEMNDKTTDESNPFLMTKQKISDSDPYSALAVVIGRAKEADNYRLTPCEFSWSKFHKAQTFEFLIDNANIKLENDFFGTYPYHTVTF